MLILLDDNYFSVGEKTTLVVRDDARGQGEFTRESNSPVVRGGRTRSAVPSRDRPTRNLEASKAFLVVIPLVENNGNRTGISCHLIQKKK